MYTVQDQTVHPLRMYFFPFFDKSEIIFTITIILAVVVIIMVANFPNKWIVPLGSYGGILAVGWATRPSIAVVTGVNINTLRDVLHEIGFKEVSPDTFAPKLPKFLLWPRSQIAISTNNCQLFLKGPRGLLTPVIDRLNQGLKLR